MSASQNAHTTPEKHMTVAAVHAKLEERGEAMQKAIENYHFLANTIPQQVWTADFDGQLDYVNETVAAYFGEPPEKIIGDGWQEVLHPDDLSVCVERWTESVQTGTPYEVEFRLRRADGTYRWHLGRALPQRDEDGQIIKWFGTNTDIHDQKQAREDAQEQAHALRTIQEINNAIAFELDQDKLVQAVTDAGTELSGAEFGAFFYNVVDAQGESLMLYTISGVPREAFSKFPMPRNTAIFNPTFQGEGVVRIDDVTQDPRYGNNAPYHGMPAGHLPVRSYLAVPVIARDDTVIGGLFFGHPDAGVFTEYSEQVVRGIAAQAAITLENARLFHQAQADLAERTRAEADLVALNESLENKVAERTQALTRAIDSLQAEVAERQQAQEELHQEKALIQLLRDVAIASNEADCFEDVLQFAIDHICAFTGWPVGHAYVLIEEDGVHGLYPTTIWHLDDPDQFAALRGITEQILFKHGEGLPGVVWETGKPSWIHNINTNPDFSRSTTSNGLGVKSGFAFPVGRGEQLQAILEFFSAEETEPDENLQAVMAHIGDQVSQVALRLEAQQALAKSQQLLDGVLNNAKDGIMALEAIRNDAGEIIDFKWLMSNPAASQLTHRPKKKLEGVTLLGEVPDIRTMGLFDAYKKVVETNTTFDRELLFEDEFVTAWFAITAVKLGDGVAITFRDITERKHNEAERAESERQLNRAQTIAHIGSWEWNIQQGSLTWSDELYRIYGLEPGSGITFEAFMDYMHPDDQAHVQGIVEASMASKEPFSFYHRIIRPDGEERIVRGDGEVMDDEDDTPLKMFGTAHDVTEQRTAERELAQSQQLLDGILTNAPDGIMALQAIRDTAGDVVDFTWLLANPAATEMTHRSEDYYLSKRLLKEVPSALASDMFVDFKKVVEEDIPVYREMYYQRDGMSGWYASTMVKLEDGLVLLFRDITERKEAEQTLERINEKLEQRNRELQDFAYVASHDLQEPLRKIRAFADLLEEDYADEVDENGRYYMDRMRDAATRMSRLLTDLLAYSRITTKARPFEEIDLNQVASEVLSDLELQISEAEGSVEVAPLPTIDADPTQMHQLLQNFISNALKFTKADERPIVTVETSIENEDDPSSALLRLEVSDNGIGFDEKYLDRIFTPFQRLHGRGTYAGTGMGLAICRRIVERHQGTLTARSSPGNGATFIVTLPLHQHHPQTEHQPT